MTQNHTTPPYHFALTDEVISRTPFTHVTEEKLIDQFSFLPTRTQEKDTGYDVRCALPGGIVLVPGRYLKIPLGFRMFAPDGWWLSLAPRSGTFVKKQCHALYGVIDETFEKELCFVCHYLPDDAEMLSTTAPRRIEFGDRIAQVMPAPRLNMPSPRDHVLSNPEMNARYLERNDPRGTGGFGSSGTA